MYQKYTTTPFSSNPIPYQLYPVGKEEEEEEKSTFCGTKRGIIVALVAHWYKSQRYHCQSGTFDQQTYSRKEPFYPHKYCIIEDEEENTLVYFGKYVKMYELIDSFVQLIF